MFDRGVIALHTGTGTRNLQQSLSLLLIVPVLVASNPIDCLRNNGGPRILCHQIEVELKYSRQSMQNRQEESDWQTPNWQPRRRKIRWKDGLTIYSELRKVGILIKIQSILIKKKTGTSNPF